MPEDPGSKKTIFPSSASRWNIDDPSWPKGLYSLGRIENYTVSQKKVAHCTLVHIFAKY